MQETSSVVELTRAETTKPQYGHIYKGHFKDKNPDIRTAGILTYAEGDNVYKTIRQPAFSAAQHLPSNIEKYSLYRYPALGEIKFHYGHANDPKYYQNMTHGMKSDDKSFRAKDCVNPEIQTRFQHLKQELIESVYKSKKSAPLGRVARGQSMPLNLNPYQTTFGVKTEKSESAKESVNPDKTRYQVELESSDKHEMYVYSHQNYEPGEQKERNFNPHSFDRHKRFGVRTEAHNDGRNAKLSLINLPLQNLERKAVYDTKLLENFRDKHTSQVGLPLDPNKETRFVGEDHTYGLLNRDDKLSAGDVVHSRMQDKLLKGKEKERAHVAVLRSHLARFNYTKFKTLADAFKFYDRNRDGFVDQLELKTACLLSGFPISDDYLHALINECDKDKDEKISFLEFANFLCFKESMRTGLKLNENEEIIKDDEGRILLNKADLEHKFHVEQNELVPKTLKNQLDDKVGNWKTTYDIINEAPYRPEPSQKRVYGIPSIRNDIAAPEFKKIQDKTNYGNDGNAWSLLTPSVFAQHGIHENDVMQPRTREEIFKIFANCGFNFSDDLFERVWNAAKSLSACGRVSIEEFRTALDQQIRNEHKEIACY